MENELEVPAAPVIPEAAAPEVVPDKRQELEKQIEAENKAIFEAPSEPEETPEVPEKEVKETLKVEEKAEDQIDPVERIKQSTQKRINQKHILLYLIT